MDSLGASGSRRDPLDGSEVGRRAACRCRQRTAQPSPRYLGTVISPHVRNLRDKVGHDLLVLPSTAVLPRDDAGRLLLVRQIDTGKWATIGGAVEPDESPHECAVREAAEEAGVTIALGDILGVLGGPEYRTTYPNGDETAYVVTVFDATVSEGVPRPDGDETSEVGWFTPDDLPLDQMGGLTKVLLRELGFTGSGVASAGQPILVLVTGLQGTGKSTVAGLAANLLGAPLFAHDWAMSGLRPFPEVQAALDAMEPPGHGNVGWSLLRALAQSQLRRGSSVVLDGVAREPQIERMRQLAAEEGARFLVVMTECSDGELHRSRVDGRERGIPGWYELTWRQVEKSLKNWDSDLAVDLKVDTTEPLSAIRLVLSDRVATLR
jgi:8-oxo-dGTP pyrophosphatase MutT (NUDIX family)/predicted kinase